MLPNNTKTRLAVLALTVSLTSLSSFAQGLDDEAALNADPIGVQTSLQNPQMDINGQYQMPSESAKLKRQTEELARKTNDMVQTKIETKRAENEKKLANEMSAMFNGQQQDQVATKQAQAQSTTEVPAEKKAEKLDPNFKVIPYAGASSMSGEGEVNFQSKVNAGLRAETLVLNKRLGIGVGFNYAATDIRDQRYTNFYYAQNQTPEFKYRNMSGELYGKFYILNENVFRPYVGAGVAYNNTKLTHTNQVNHFNQFGNQGVNNQGYNSNYASGSALVGTDILFTERVGINFEFKYSTAFSSAFNNDNQGINQNFQGFDSAYLQQLGQQMDDATIMAINAGIVINF